MFYFHATNNNNLKLLTVNDFFPHHLVNVYESQLLFYLDPAHIIYSSRQIQLHNRCDMHTGCARVMATKK